MRPSLVMSWLTGALLGLAASVAHGAEVDWRAPDACPDGDELRFRIERAIAMPLSHAAPLRFVVRAEPSGQGFAARIEVQGGTRAVVRQRALGAVDCPQLVDMVTVAVALALGVDTNASDTGEADRASSTGADTRGSTAPVNGERDPIVDIAHATPSNELPAGADGASSIDTPEDSPAARSPTARDNVDGLRPVMSLWLLGDSGSLPRPGAGAAFGAQLEGEHFQLRALGTWLYGQHEPLAVAGARAVGADLALVLGALSACARPWRSWAGLAASGCAGWELGRLSGEGTGVERPRAGAALWSAPRFDLGLSWALGSSDWRVGALLTLVLPLARDNFLLSDIGSVHRPPSGLGRLALGLEWAPR